MVWESALVYRDVEGSREEGGELAVSGLCFPLLHATAPDSFGPRASRDTKQTKHILIHMASLLARYYKIM